MIRLQLSKKDLGEYKATLKDERGQDVTVLEIGGKGKGKAPATPRETRVTAGVTCHVDVPPPPPGPVRIGSPAEGARPALRGLRSRSGGGGQPGLTPWVSARRRVGPSDVARTM